ncbi:MAG: hypothetical protein ACO3DT_04905 [Gammaproteobacteria bacterium]|nr:hypothetical protein [Gammaproteobacteria bacterium]
MSQARTASAVNRRHGVALLRFGLPRVTAFDGVSFEIEASQLYPLINRSGRIVI